MTPSSNSNDNSKEFSIIIKKLDDITSIKTDVALLNQNQKHQEKAQEDMKDDIVEIFKNKASKTDLGTIASALAKHIDNHFLLFLCIVGSILTSLGAIIVAWTSKG